MWDWLTFTHLENLSELYLAFEFRRADPDLYSRTDLLVHLLRSVPASIRLIHLQLHVADDEPVRQLACLTEVNWSAIDDHLADLVPSGLAEFSINLSVGRTRRGEPWAEAYENVEVVWPIRDLLIDLQDADVLNLHFSPETID